MIIQLLDKLMGVDRSKYPKAIIGIQHRWKPWVRVARFPGPNLIDLEVNSSILNYANFSGRDMQGVVFYKCRCNGADFSHCNLVNADLRDNFMDYADFTSANLQNAIFTESTLRGALFHKANLKDADFRGADVSETSFIGAYLKGAKFDEDMEFHPLLFQDAIF